MNKFRIACRRDAFHRVMHTLFIVSYVPHIKNWKQHNPTKTIKFINQAKRGRFSLSLSHQFSWLWLSIELHTQKVAVCVYHDVTIPLEINATWSLMFELNPNLCDIYIHVVINRK